MPSDMGIAFSPSQITWTGRISLFFTLTALGYLVDLEIMYNSVHLSILAFVIYLLTGGHYTLYLMWHTLGRDARYAYS